MALAERAAAGVLAGELTGVPSISSEPMARVSPMPQSIVPFSTEAARRCICGIRRGWTVIDSGMLTWDSAIRFTTSAETAVSTATGNAACGSGMCGAAGCEVASRTSAKTFSS